MRNGSERVRDWFASDLHLREGRPQSMDFLARLLEAMGAGDRLWLLGDIFDAWMGESRCQIERDAEALLAEAARQRPVAAMRGNRDVLLDSAWCRRLGLRLLADPCVLERDGRRLLLSHGDAWCTADAAYMQTRRQMRGFAMQSRFLAMPLQQRVQEVAKLRQRSEGHQARADPAILDVVRRDVLLARRAWKADAVLHGHTHLPGVHAGELDGRPRVVLGEWRERAEVCRLDEDGFALLDAAREGLPELARCAWQGGLP